MRTLSRKIRQFAEAVIFMFSLGRELDRRTRPQP